MFPARSSTERWGGKMKVTFWEFMMISSSGKSELSTECSKVNAIDLLVYLAALMVWSFSSLVRYL